jgi:hypothetical protein
MAVLQPTPGDILLTATLERAVCETLKEWMPFYVAHVDEQEELDRGTTAVPRYFDAASDDSRRWMEAPPPAALVVSSGTVENPQRHGDRAAYGAWWQVNVAISAAGATEQGSRAIASRLGGAATALIVQQGDFGGLVEETAWRGTRIDKIGRERPAMIAEIACECWIPNVVATRGPLIPRELPDDPTQPAAPIPQPDSASEDAEISP